MNSFGVPVLFTTPSLQQNCLKESLLWILMWTPDLRTLRQDTPQFKLNLNHTAIFHLKITAIVVDERTKIENIARIWRTLTTSFKFSLVKANTTVIKTGSNEGLGVEPSAVWKKSLVAPELFSSVMVWNLVSWERLCPWQRGCQHYQRDSKWFGKLYKPHWQSSGRVWEGGSYSRSSYIGKMLPEAMVLDRDVSYERRSHCCSKTCHILGNLHSHSAISNHHPK